MTQEVIIPEGVKVIVDKKTKARTFGVPFVLPDGTNAVLMVARLRNEDWKPEVKNVILNYND